MPITIVRQLKLVRSDPMIQLNVHNDWNALRVPKRQLSTPWITTASTTAPTHGQGLALKRAQP